MEHGGLSSVVRIAPLGGIRDIGVAAKEYFAIA
jgi:hypothetical protein